MKNKYDSIIVAGCGSLGKTLALALSNKSFSVIAIDIDKEASFELASDFSGFWVVGDATDIEVLKTAGISTASSVICTTGSDSINYTIATIASEIFKVKNVYMRVDHPSTKKLVEGTNIKTICPTELSVQEFERLSSVKIEEDLA